MRWNIDLEIIEVNVLENLGLTLGYMMVWFLFLSSNPTLYKAFFQFFVTFVIFVAIDNLFRYLILLISKILDHIF